MAAKTLQQKLIEIQAELKAPKSQFNKFGGYNYRNCEDILEAVKPLCAKHDVVPLLSDEIVMIGERYYVKSIAKITDGKDEITTTAFARESFDKKGMDESQITGSASSYARKYALNGLFCIDDTKDADTLINTVKLLQKNFAGINLEDISSPKCYEVENRLKAELEIPVFHDDQHGTAIACLAGVKGALRLVKKDLATAKIVVNGAGAAGANIARLLYLAGARDITLLVSSGVLHKDYKRLDSLQAELIDLLKLEEKHGDLAENAKGADILLGVSAAGAFTKEILESLADDAIVFAMANPNPEATYADMKAAGIRVAGTGRSDAPNQINNVAVFPGVFRGAIDVRASQITDEMKLAAADALAHLIPDSELNEENVMPSVFDPRVAPAVAKAVAEVAVKQGIAKNPQAIEDGSYEG